MAIQVKRGTKSQWETQNPKLDAGQPGFEIDTNKLKIGDGTTNWNSLPYIAGDGSGNIAWSNSADGSDGFTTVYPGENLLLNSLPNSLTGWTASNSSVHELVITGDFPSLPNGAVRCIKNTATTINANEVRDVVLETGKRYTLSMYVYVPSSNTGAFYLKVYYINNGWQYLSGALITERDIWIRKSVTFVANGTYANHVVGFGAGNVTTGSYFYVCAYKLEVENNPDPVWTPAPSEDPENAYPKYIGIPFISTSSNPTDYAWVKIGDSTDQSNKLDANNPIGTGSFSMNRKVGSDVGLNSVTTGNNGIASKANAYAGGDTNTASGSCSCAMGTGTFATNSNTYSGGLQTNVSGHSAFSHSVYGSASNYACAVFGKANTVMTTGGAVNNQVGDVFALGNGTGSSNRSNAFRVTYAGATYGLSAFNSSGADYAEFIKEWHDGNPNDEDRVGYFVTIGEDELLHKAEAEDIIVGITSGNPSIVGNADEDYYWKYERDEFNRIIMEDVPEIIQEVDETTGETIYRATGKIIENGRMKLNPDYNSILQENYVERKNRKEWSYVGLTGVVPVRDDGTCVPGKMCKVGSKGMATYADSRTFDTYLVIERINSNVVSVLIK